jgi:hypothetical protein
MEGVAMGRNKCRVRREVVAVEVTESVAQQFVFVPKRFLKPQERKLLDGIKCSWTDGGVGMETRVIMFRDSRDVVGFMRASYAVGNRLELVRPTRRVLVSVLNFDLAGVNGRG